MTASGGGATDRSILGAPPSPRTDPAAAVSRRVPAAPAGTAAVWASRMQAVSSAAPRPQLHTDPGQIQQQAGRVPTRLLWGRQGLCSQSSSFQPHTEPGVSPSYLALLRHRLPCTEQRCAGQPWNPYPRASMEQQHPGGDEGFLEASSSHGTGICPMSHGQIWDDLWSFPPALTDSEWTPGPSFPVDISFAQFGVSFGQFEVSFGQFGGFYPVFPEAHVSQPWCRISEVTSTPPLVPFQPPCSH